MFIKKTLKLIVEKKYQLLVMNLWKSNENKDSYINFSSLTGDQYVSGINPKIQRGLSRKPLY